MSTLRLAIISGVLLGLAVDAIVAAFLPQPIRLADALALLDPEQLPDAARPAGILIGPDPGWADRLGVWGYRRLRVPLTGATMQALSMSGRPIADFVAEKLLLALIGLTTPLMLAGTWIALGGGVSMVPLGLSLACALAGFLLPDIRLRRSAPMLKADAGQALSTFFDLVTLERLANASAAQALQAAANLSDHPLFLKIRTALDRARLQQRPPWQELKALARQIDLPEIADVADVMRLDEQGASLSHALTARVAEIRDAHLTREKIAAQTVSESMTVWMVVPTMIFGLIFLVPPMLRLAGLAP